MYDYNPFIIFSNSKVIYTNEAGEYLLSFVSFKDIYNKIISKAPKDKGFLYVHEKFDFGKFSYDYALIGYDNYEEIGVRFYQNIKPVKDINTDFESFNIYFIIDLVRTYIFIDKDIKFIDVFDVDLPDIVFDKNKIINALKKVYELFKDNDIVETEVKLKIGEYLKIKNKKYKILEISIGKTNKKLFIEDDLIDIINDNQKISILIPFITKEQK